MRIATNEQDKAYCNYNMGRIYELRGKFQEAYTCYNAYRQGLHREIEYHYEVARFLGLSFDKPAEARAAFDEAILLSREYVKNVDDLPFAEKKLFIEAHDKYLNYVATFTSGMVASNPELANDLYNLLLYTKAVQMNSSLRLANFVNSSMDSSVRTISVKLKTKRNQLAGATSDAQRIILKNEMTRLERALYAKSDVAVPVEKSNISWKQVQSHLGPAETAVEIMRYTNVKTRQSRYLALVIRGQQMQKTLLVELGEAASLENRSFKFYMNFINSVLPDTLSYKTFWGALEPFVSNSKTIYLAQDGVYYKVNLNTLLNPATRRYLLEDMNIKTVLSTRELVETGLEPASEKPEHAILFGSPDFDGLSATTTLVQKTGGIKLPGKQRSMSFAYLPGAKKELNTLDGYLRNTGMTVQTFTDGNASEENLKLIARPDVLHIATHGFFFEPGQATDLFQQKFNSPDPMFNSGLLLAGVLKKKISPSAEDGILTAFEATNLDLASTKLVILSACETGSGEIQNGEGVFGLQRAFKMAGAQRLIMSLWKVDDEVTQQLMTEFYGFWLSGMNIQTAFYMAQINVKKQHPAPYFWGAFVML